jgi:peptidoglycan/xylan/chitin deacetylase (PgdA/CDA1 family)
LKILIRGGKILICNEICRSIIGLQITRQVNMAGVKLVHFLARVAVLVLVFQSVPSVDVLADEPATKGVVIMYHRFGELDYPSTNVTMDQFREHIQELKSGDYNVISLPEMIDAVRAKRSLPDKSVALSVDDAYESVYSRAWPLLKEAGFPLTVFVATEALDKNRARYMTWQQLRELQAEGVTIGSQTETHPHMPDLSLEQIQGELARSNARFESELNEVPNLFAYPYGETDMVGMEAIKAAGFIAAFGQHSGAIASGNDLYFLPRFAMNEAFGSLDRFKLAANALPLGVQDFTPTNPTISDNNPPNIGFTVTWPTRGLDRLNCFASHAPNASIERLGSRIEVRTEQSMPAGRTRLNCTMPAGDGRWHWFGRQFYVAR